ncbi:MAG: shikimate dehydrogenase [Rhizobiaceae bacterium]
MASEIHTFVTGWPVEHSRSPLIHRHWIKIYGLSGDYEKLPCSELEFPKFLKDLPKSIYRGGNVTIPHKEAAFQQVTVVHPTAKALGAVNTLWQEGDVLHGDNTDGYGFLANLDDRAKGWDGADRQQRGALVLGAGGAARAIIYALLERGFNSVTIANRTLERAEKLADKFGPKCQAADLKQLSKQTYDCALVVNTTSVGMDGKSLVLDLTSFSTQTVVNDIVYTPLLTPLLKQAKTLGLQTVDGLGMLLHQAVPGFERWYGVRPAVDEELRGILLRDLGEGWKRSGTYFLGLTGSIGMGKSTTAQMFRDAGIPVHDSDATVHHLYSGEAAPLIEEAFAGTVRDGVVDRVKLGQQVVGNDVAMKKLEAIIHPLVRREELAFRGRVKQEKAPLAILDIPLLFETKSETRVDGILVVTAPADVQQERVLAREGMSVVKFDAIMKRQYPDVKKRKQADYIIDTSQGLEAAQQEVLGIIKEISKMQETDRANNNA